MNEEKFDRLLKSIYELKRDINYLTPPPNGRHPMLHLGYSIYKAKEYMKDNFPEFKPTEEIDERVKL